MRTVSIIAVAVIVLLVVDQLRRRYRNRVEDAKNASRLASLMADMELARQGDVAAISRLDHDWRNLVYTLSASTRRQYNEALLVGRQERDYRQALPGIQARYTAWQAAATSDASTRLQLLGDLLNRVEQSRWVKSHDRLRDEHGIDLEALGKLIPEVMLQAYAELLPQAEESREAFLDLYQLVFFGNRDYGRYCGYNRLNLPENWDRLVVRYIKQPTRSDFRDLPDLRRGESRLLAAQALREEDLELALKLLAIHDSDPRNSDLEPAMRVELAKLVADMADTRVEAE